MPQQMATASPPAAAQLKGALLNTMLTLVAHDVGEAAFEQLQASFPPALRQAIAAHTILDGTWYDVRWANALTLAAYPRGPAQKQACRMFGRRCITRLLSGPHRFLIRSISPSTVVSQTSLFFRSYYRGGVVSSAVTAPKTGYYRAMGFVDIDPALWHAILGGCEVVLEAAGARDVRIWRDDAHEGPDILAHVTWA